MNSGFVRRQNDDSTTDLICLGCFQTVFHLQEQGEGTPVNSDHVCNPFEVERLHAGSEADIKDN